MAQSRLPRWCTGTLTVLGLAAVVWGTLAAAGVAAWLGWWAELIGSFWFSPLVGGLLGLVLIVLGRSRAGLVLAGVGLVVIGGLTIVPPPQLEEGDGRQPTLKLATWNAYLGSADPEQVLAWLEEHSPDVIAFTEITQKLHGVLKKPLKTAYPYQLGRPRNGPRGLAVFSKVPISNWSFDKITERYGSCDLQWPSGPSCRLIIAHPDAPTWPIGFEGRRQSLRALGSELARETRPILALGDFNANWESSDFRQFCRVARLLPASGNAPSWNADLPAFLQTAIDHVLATPEHFRSVSFSSGPTGGGSDHLPVLAEVELKPGADSR